MNKRRVFNLAKGVVVEIAFHHGRQMHVAQIFVPANTKTSQCREYCGYSGVSRLKAYKKARHELRMDTDPGFRAVYERLTGEANGITVAKLLAVKEKLLMTDKNQPPKRFYTNSKMAERFKAQINIYERPGQLAGLNPPVVIVDDQIEDNQILKEENYGKGK